MQTPDTLTAGRTRWNQNANYCGPTRYAAERGHGAAVAAGNYWIVRWTQTRGEHAGEQMFSALSAQHLALSFAKDLVRNPGFDDVTLATIRTGDVARVADADTIRDARY